jgi:AraC-like DNA-binding protein
MSKDCIDTAPAAVEIVEIGDPTLANAATELIEQDVVQLQSTPLRARQVIVRLDGCMVVYYSTNLRVRTRPRLSDELVGYVTFSPQASGTFDGLPIQPDSMLAVPPAVEVGFVADAGYESITYLVHPADLRAHLETRGREDEFVLPQAVRRLHVDGGLARDLFAWGMRLVDIAASQPQLFEAHREQRIAAKVDLMEALLAALAATSDLEPERRERTQQAQSSIVRKAERYALAHTGDRLYVTDLCRAAGVSERTLEYAFKAVMGLRPVAYLTRLRLHRVHQALLHASKGSTTVTTEALNWGFWHFGEFSRAYRECFGELPSDTLGRTPESQAGRE